MSSAMVGFMLKKKNTQNSQNSTHFGFKNVNIEEKPILVKGVFDSVAHKYDLMNDIMSFGMHRLWKNTLIRRLKPTQNKRVIDVGGGTGDIALKLVEKGCQNIVVTDINTKMLEAGRNRAMDQAVINEIKWIAGNAEQLPYEDLSFDAYTTAFCLRNVTNIERALKEAFRVLKPGGRFLCLEFSHVILPSLEKIYEQYSFKLLPLMGQVIANDRAAYQYLAESIRRFPKQNELTALIKGSGLERISHQNLCQGVVAIHSAWKI